MIKKKLLIASLIIILFSACKGKTIEHLDMKNNSNSFIINHDIKYIIPKDLIKDSIDIIENYTSLKEWINNYDDSSDDVNPIIKDKDILIGSKVKNSLLVERGFNFVSDTIYNKRIEYIFGFSLSEKKSVLYTTTNYTIYSMQRGLDECEYVTMFPDGFLDMERRNYFFLKNYNFFTITAPLLTNSIKKSEDGNIIEFIVSDLEYHENNYVFNDSKSSLTWLINNDYYFLEDLVKEFGYDKEPKINKAVLNNIYIQYQEKNENKDVTKYLFFRKDCNGNLRIREGLMDFLVSESTNTNYGALKMLEDYGYALGNNSTEDQDLFYDLTPNEKDKLSAYIFYYVHKAYLKNDIGPGLKEWNPASVLYNMTVSNPELIQRIKNNNYYNLSGLQKMIEDIELEISDIN